MLLATTRHSYLVGTLAVWSLHAISSHWSFGSKRIFKLSNTTNSHNNTCGNVFKKEGVKIKTIQTKTSTYYTKSGFIKNMHVKESTYVYMLLYFTITGTRSSPGMPSSLENRASPAGLLRVVWGIHVVVVTVHPEVEPLGLEVALSLSDGHYPDPVLLGQDPLRGEADGMGIHQLL